MPPPPRVRYFAPAASAVALLLGPCVQAQARAVWDFGASADPRITLRSSAAFALGRASGLLDGVWMASTGTDRWVMGNLSWRFGPARSRILLAPGLEGAEAAGSITPETAYEAANIRIGFADSAGRGSWLRVGAGRLWDAGGSRSLLLAGFGAAIRRGRLGVTLSVTEAHVPPGERAVTFTPSLPPLDTLGVPPPGPTTQIQRVAGRAFREVRAQLDFSGGPITARLLGGAETGEGIARTTGWLRVETMAWLSSDVAIVVGLGRPSLPILQTRPPGGPVTLALRAAFGARAPRDVKRPRSEPAPVDMRFEVQAAEGEVRILRVRVPHARTVDLTGDFVDWQVVSLTRGPDDLWETRLAIRPGSYRVNIRVNDGPWVVPPGLRAVRDDFNGYAGSLQIE